MDGIKTNIENNMSLILLGTEYLPQEVLNKMKKYYEKL